MIDGVRDDVQYYRDLYNSERVAVLKGSPAMIFGRGGGGEGRVAARLNGTYENSGAFATSRI